MNLPPSADPTRPVLVPTADGSYTLRHPDLGVTYHSEQGAWGETQHVFIQASGMAQRLQHGPVRVLEVGFGTGLNAAATALEAAAANQTLDYLAYEPHLLPPDLLASFYQAVPQVPNDLARLLGAGKSFQWGPFQLLLHRQAWPAGPAPAAVDVVLFDAFDPKTAPDLWATGLLAAAECLRPDGVLVTYSVTGETKQRLRTAGFAYERLPGFGRKRHMLRVHARGTRL